MIDSLFDEIINKIEVNEIDYVVELCGKMSSETYDKIVDKMIDLLKESNLQHIKNTTAIILSDLKCNKAIPVLIELIKEPLNFNKRGTYVYALENLDCADYIKDMLELLYNGNIETRYNMYSVIKNQVNNMSKQDIEFCGADLEKQIERLTDIISLLYDVAENLLGINLQE